MAIYRPDIKPPMWGPPDAVQFAVRANAERMGVDADKVIAIPLWEGTGGISQGYGFANLHMGFNPLWVGGNRNFPNIHFIEEDRQVISAPPYTLVARAMCRAASGAHVALWTGDRTTIGDSTAIRFRPFDSANGFGAYSHSGGFNESIINKNLVQGRFYDLCGVFSGGSSRLIYVDGEPGTVNTTSVSHGAEWNRVAIGANRRSAPTDYLNGIVAHAYIFNVALTPSQIATLHHTPYALLMPVARPVFFDLGGEPPGPGVPYSLTQDMLAGVSSAWVMTQDGMVQIATPRQFTQDGVMAVSLAYANDQDGLASTSSSHATTQDGTASVSTSWLIIQDGDAAVSEITGYYVTMDAVSAISEEVATTQDGSGGVSSTYALEQDGTGQVSSSYLAVQDAQAQVSEGVIYTVTMDAMVQVSEVITIRQDVVVGIATSYEQLQDIASGISSGYAIVQDGRAHVIEVDFAQMARVLKVSSGMTAISIKSVGKVRQAFKSASKLTIIQI